MSKKEFIVTGVHGYANMTTLGIQRLKTVEIRKEMRYAPHIQMGRVWISLAGVKGYGW